MPATFDPAATPVAQIVIVSEDWASADRRPPAQAPTAPKREAASTPLTLPATALADQHIKAAVAETIAVASDKSRTTPIQHAALRSAALSADNTSFAKQIAHAKVPGCMGADGLKFQPPQLGPIVFSGVFTLPFLIVAAARGKCK